MKGILISTHDFITVYGDGKQTRSFCYVSDLIAGMVKMMNQDSFTGPVNLGNPNEFTILNFLRLPNMKLFFVN